MVDFDKEIELMDEVGLPEDATAIYSEICRSEKLAQMVERALASVKEKVESLPAEELTELAAKLKVTMLTVYLIGRRVATEKLIMGDLKEVN